jgi:type II secretory pathway component GspD/PulD (secretin)
LNYLQASEVLSILGDALARISDDSGSGSGGGKAGGNPIGSTANNNQQRTGDFGSSGSNRGGMGGGLGSSYGGAGGGSSFGGGSGLQSKRQAGPPTSLVMGKTLIISDPTQNSIFASGPPEHLETVNQIIDALDIRPQQVFLSVVIGQLKLTDNHDFGIDYLFGPTEVAAGKYSGMGAGTVKNRVGTNQNILDPTGLKGVGDLASKIPTGISLYGTIYDNVNVVISALDSNSNFKVLSRPSVFTLNNEPASIETGQQIPVPASTYSSYNPNVGTGTTDGVNQGQFSQGFQSNIQYMDVSLRLDVVPVINSEEDITLQIKQVNKERGDSIAISGNNIPSIINQGLETTVITKNNATVLLGGLIREDHSKKESGVPLLRHIPVIKKLFSSTEDTTSRSELLIFIQPRIVNGNGDLPNNAGDAPGASPLGEEIRRFMNQEKSDPLKEEKAVKRSKIGDLIRKLFN